MTSTTAQGENRTAQQLADDRRERRRRQKREWSRRNYNKGTYDTGTQTSNRRSARHARRDEDACYDIASYVADFAFLTKLGRSAGSIISGSIPEERWFANHVLPLVRAAICSRCERQFNPQSAGSIVWCSPQCKANRT